MMCESLVRLLSPWAAAWSDHALAILWQSALVFALVWPAARLVRRQGPVVRRALWALVLIRLVLPADFALPVGIGNLAKPILAEPASAVHAPRPVSAPAHDRLPVAAVSLPSSPAPALTAADTQIPAPVPVTAAPAVPRSSFSFELAAFAVWLAGVLALAVLLLRRHRAIRASVRSAQPVAAGPLREMFLRCCRRIPPPILFRPTLCISRDLTTPMLVGIWRPRVIIPQRLLEVCSPEELEALVLHELAHIRQWDLLINCAQLALQVAHWYNPLVWLANREMRRERELACDDRVLLATGLRRREYAAGLLKVLELTPPRLAWSLSALSVAESKTTFRWRIKRIMDAKLKPSPRLTILSLAALLLFGAVVLAAAPYQASTEVPRPEPEQAAPPAGEHETIAAPNPRPSVPPGELACDPQMAAELARVRSELMYRQQHLPQTIASLARTYSEAMAAKQRELAEAAARLDTARSELLAKQETLRAKAEELSRIRSEVLAERQRAIEESTAEPLRGRDLFARFRETNRAIQQGTPELNHARSELLAAHRQFAEAAAEVHHLQHDILTDHCCAVQEAWLRVRQVRTSLLQEHGPEFDKQLEEYRRLWRECRPELEGDRPVEVPRQVEHHWLPMDPWLLDEDRIVLLGFDGLRDQWFAYLEMLSDCLPDDPVVHLDLTMRGSDTFSLSVPTSDLMPLWQWYLTMLPPGVPFSEEELRRFLEGPGAGTDLTTPAPPDRAPLHPDPNPPPPSTHP